MLQANGMRTIVQTVTTTPVVLDVTKILHGEDVLAVMIMPQVISSVEMRGANASDDWVNLGGGLELGIDFDVHTASNLLMLRSVSGSREVSLFFSINKR